MKTHTSPALAAWTVQRRNYSEAHVRATLLTRGEWPEDKDFEGLEVWVPRHGGGEMQVRITSVVSIKALAGSKTRTPLVVVCSCVETGQERDEPLSKKTGVDRFTRGTNIPGTTRP